MSTPALYNIKTVTGLQDCLVLQVIDSLGNVISGNNYVVRGAIALKGETYNLSVTQDALGDYLLTWENLPAGVWRYDIFVNEEPLLYGNAIVQGRVTPCVTDNLQDLGQFLQVQKDQEGVVKITLSDVNSAKWYAEVAKGSADEAKNVLQETENLSLDIERQIEAGKTEISETTESSISSINTAENTAIANIDTEKENALDDLSQEVVKAQNYATSAQNSATQSATSATNAQESETKAKEAQTETETLANELDEKFERAVFTDNSGNVDIEGGLTVDGTANLNAGAVVPEITKINNSVNANDAYGFGVVSTILSSPLYLMPESCTTSTGGTIETHRYGVKINTANAFTQSLIKYSRALSNTRAYNKDRGVLFRLTLPHLYGWGAGLKKISFAERNAVVVDTANMDECVFDVGTGYTVAYDITINTTSSNGYYEIRTREVFFNSTEQKRQARVWESKIPSANENFNSMQGILFMRKSDGSMSLNKRVGGIWLLFDGYTTSLFRIASPYSTHNEQNDSFTNVVFNAENRTGIIAGDSTIFRTTGQALWDLEAFNSVEKIEKNVIESETIIDL